jgi:mycothiol synthase
MQTAPDGYFVRRPTKDDGTLIYDIVAAHNIAVIGNADYTQEDAADELLEPAFDLDQDGWLVFTSDDVPAGWATAARKGESANTEIQVYTVPAHQPALAPWLWEQAQTRAIELASAAGHSSTDVDNGLYLEDTFMRELAATHGYAPAARFVRMKIEHQGVPAEPAAPSGVELRHGTTDEQVRRDSFAVRNQSFHDHFGYYDSDYDSWVAYRESSSAHDWSLVHVAYLDGQPVATLVRTNHFVPDENLGYVLTLGTIPSAQGRGLASYLLHYAFAADAALGREGTVLHVDSNPERPALGLYQRAGMHQILAIDTFRRTITA